MKYLMLVCEGLADEPLKDLAGRTPLEAAKTPFMDLLAKKGRLGLASFVPHSLPLSSEVAAMSLLGFDPRKLYSGIAPLEALAMGLEQNDQTVAFRADLVTILDDVLVDPSTSHISQKESDLLVEDLNRKFSDAKIRLHAGQGHKNILLVRDPEKVHELDQLECTPPAALVGQKIARHLPKGRGAELITGLMDKSREVLADHEINRVRIDLGENPATMIWPWGQGLKPKLRPFLEKHRLRGAAVSNEEAIRGLAKGLGLAAAESWVAALKEFDFVLHYQGFGPEIKRSASLKDKVRRIEEFDASVVEPASKILESQGEALRVFVGTGIAESLEKKSLLHGQTPFLVAGHGVQAATHTGFHEKHCAESDLKFSEGHKLIEFFLK